MYLCPLNFNNLFILKIIEHWLLYHNPMPPFEKKIFSPARATPARRRPSQPSLPGAPSTAPMPTIPGWLSPWWIPTSAVGLLPLLCSLRCPLSRPRDRGTTPPPRRTLAPRLASPYLLYPASECRASKRRPAASLPFPSSPGAARAAAATTPRGGLAAAAGPLAAECVPSSIPAVMSSLCLSAEYFVHSYLFPCFVK